MKKSAYLLALTLLAAAPLSAQSSGGSVANPVLRPGDAAQITIWPQQELGGQFPIDERGTLNLPLIGPIQAGGLTVEELRQTLTSAYQLDMQNPIVTVTPLFTVLVLGQVRSPGVYQVPPITPFLQVVAMAGGFTVSADEANVRLVRNGAVTQINALTAMETGVGLEAYTIQSGDQIVVPAQSGITWRDVLSIVQLAATLSLIYTRLSR